MGKVFRSRNLMWILLLAASVAAGLALIYRGAPLNYPLGYYGDDGLGVFYVVKTIRDHGISLVNPQTGGVSGADMYDYPYGCYLPFLLVKLISLFVSDVYRITNLFYFLCYLLSALTAFCVLRKLRISEAVSWTTALLFAFSPYIQMRYTHMWVLPYFMMPFSCLIAVWIVEGAFWEKAEGGAAAAAFSGAGRRSGGSRTAAAGAAGGRLRAKRLFHCIFLAFLVSWTGVYYAFFSCALFALAALVRMLREKKVLRNLYPLLFVFASGAGVAVNIFPTVLYTLKNGPNPMSETATRLPFESELYSLKLIQLLMPRNGHRIRFLAEIKNYYNVNSASLNESTTSTLGLVAAAGFTAAILLLMRGRSAKDSAKSRELCLYDSVPPLVLGSFLIATVGGVSSIVSLLVSSPVRGYNRMSTTIMFLCLLITAQWMELLKQAFGGKRLRTAVLCLAVAGVGIFDQTVDCGASDTSEIDNARSFAAQIEEEMDDGALIFEYPYVDWPGGGCYRLFLGYLESSSLRWSFASMQGRKEAQWQSGVASLPSGKMIRKLQKAGYAGLYLDTAACLTIAQAGGLSEDAARVQTEQKIESFTEKTGRAPLVSKDGKLYFWSLETGEENGNQAAEEPAAERPVTGAETENSAGETGEGRQTGKP